MGGFWRLTAGLQRQGMRVPLILESFFPFDGKSVARTGDRGTCPRGTQLSRGKGSFSVVNLTGLRKVNLSF